MIEQGQRVRARQSERQGAARVLLTDRVVQNAEDLRQKVSRLVQHFSRRRTIRRHGSFFGQVMHFGPRRSFNIRRLEDSCFGVKYHFGQALPSLPLLGGRRSSKVRSYAPGTLRANQKVSSQPCRC